MIDETTEYLEQALQLFKQAAQADYMDDLFKLLLTTDEIDSVAVRVQIIKELLKGQLNQRDLKEKLGTGIATITRGSNSLKLSKPDFKTWLNQQLNNH